MNIVSETSDISHWGAEAERGKPIPWLERLNDIVGMLVEFPAALLVAAEVVVLLMGVIWRYVLHTPLVWSDELASILFLWLAMLGSIVALRREHPTWGARKLRELLMRRLGPGVAVPARSTIHAVLDRHVSGKEDLSRQLWGLLAFTLWHEHHVEREPAALASERMEALVR